MQKVQSDDITDEYFEIMIIKLKEKFKSEVIPAMKEKFGYKSEMQVPRIKKVVLNTSFGKQIAGQSNDEQKKVAEFVVGELGTLSGQKAVMTRARKSIASFKLREGMVIGVKVTLRGEKMNDFLERFISLTLPRTRDFRGINPKSFDEKGNMTVAVREHIVFPEILPEKAKNIFGMEVTVVTTAKNKEESRELLKLLGFPIAS